MDRPLLVRSTWLEDPSLGAPIERAALLISGGRVVAAGRAADIQAPEGAELLDLGDLTVVPGMIDAHGHLANFWSPLPVRRLDWEDERLLLFQAARNGSLAVSAGVTTVRDCGGQPGVSQVYQKAIAQGLVEGPNVIACHRVVSCTGGHLHFMGYEADSPEQLRVAARSEAKAGADFLKVTSSGGRSTPGRANLRRASQFTASELRLLVEECRRFGLPVAAHAHSASSIEACAAAGVDSIEHCLWLGEKGGLRYSPQAVEEILRQGLFVVLTLGAFFPHPSTNTPDDAELWASDELFEFYARMRQAGVRFVPGGDTGGPHTPFNQFVWHLEQMARFGMTPRELLAAATCEAAACLHRPDLGALLPGRRADFVAVRGRPWLDIRNLWNVERVFRQGRPAWSREAV